MLPREKTEWLWTDAGGLQCSAEEHNMTINVQFDLILDEKKITSLALGHIERDWNNAKK